jgi:hypothetical protein
MGLLASIAARLAADLPFAGELATYGEAPAIVVGDDGKLPENIPTPFALVAFQASTPDDCKVEDGHEARVAVRIFADATGSVKVIEQLTERARWLLHRKPSGLADGAYIAECSVAIAPTDASFYGRQIDVRVVSLDI